MSGSDPCKSETVMIKSEMFLLCFVGLDLVADEIELCRIMKI